MFTPLYIYQELTVVNICYPGSQWTLTTSLTPPPWPR